MPNPTLKPSILIAPTEDGYVAYDPATDTLHQLNPFASLLVELCDGKRNVDEIRALIAPLMQPDQAGELDRWVEDGLKSGLLVWSDAPGEGLKQFSASEMYEFVVRLKDFGAMQTAYICAKRVVELEPEDWQAWYLLGDLCQYVGKREEALNAFQKYFAANPDDAEIEHLLIALRDDTPPVRMSNRTIQHIYKGFAKSFDTRLVDDLKYQGPERLSEAIKAAIGDRTGLSVLDIGCGSGLAGVRLRPIASVMYGVDLSPEMLELARKREIYDRLENAEITEWIENAPEQFDIIAACDCLIYFGDLHGITAAAAGRLKSGGIFAFSLERGNKFPLRLTDTGRYEHHPDHVREISAAAGLTMVRLDEAFLRYEYTSEVVGLFAVLQKDNRGPV
jgi:predicted TPR repeat methyltransferase